MNSGRILIACAGLGMGNASRIAAVLEALAAKSDPSVRVLSWGAGYRFLKGFQRQSRLPFELKKLNAYPSEQALAKIFKPKMLLHYLSIYAKNILLVRAEVKKWKPDVIVLDSDYHFPAYFFFGIPVIFIGQACDVLERAKENPSLFKSPKAKFTFFVREKFDSILQLSFCDLLLVPSFSPAASVNPKVAKIPLIARREFVRSNWQTRDREEFGILLSGSELEQNEILNAASKYGIPVIRPSKDTIPSNSKQIDQFDVVLTQGGLSSITECIARNRFVVVVPMSQHPEQILNAVQVEKMGVGINANQEDIGNLPGLLDRARKQRSNSQRGKISCYGAQVAADAIVGFLKPPIH